MAKYRLQSTEGGHMADIVARWRADAVAIIANRTSTESQRLVAWRFLKQWGL